jgi:hypothetical protein
MSKNFLRKQCVKTHVLEKNVPVVLTPTLFCLSGKIRSAKMERSMPDQYMVGYLLADAGDRFSSRKHWYLFLKHKLPVYARRFRYHFTQKEIDDLIDFIMIYMEPKTTNQLKTTHILKEYLLTRYGVYTILQLISEFGHMNTLRIVETRDTITVYGLSWIDVTLPQKGIRINKNNIKPYAQMLFTCWQNMKLEYHCGCSDYRALTKKFIRKMFGADSTVIKEFDEYVRSESASETER